MNRTDLIKRMAQLSELPQATCRSFLEQLQATISQALHEGETVYVPKLGVFEIRHHLPRSGRNPQTGATIQIPMRTLPAFKPATQLKDALK